ncbi:MAG: hypothetical protein M0022_09280 [Desulfobacteraceae bacterium]|nr:hypothetical protein [Desulfobacteraceae bacterium]
MVAMEMQGFCQKDNRETALSRGCLHPKDYCPYRQSCMIYYLVREQAKGAERKDGEDVRRDEDTVDQ